MLTSTILIKKLLYYNLKFIEILGFLGKAIGDKQLIIKLIK